MVEPAAAVRVLGDSARVIDGTATSLTLAADSTVSGLKVGDIIVSAGATASYLRKITDIAEAADGTRTLITQDAGLDDLFSQVRASRYGEFQSFTPADGVEVLSQSGTTRAVPYAAFSAPPAPAPVDQGRTVPLLNLELSHKAVEYSGEGSAKIKLSLAAIMELESQGVLQGVDRLTFAVDGDWEFSTGLAFKAAEYRLQRRLGRVRIIFWFGPVPVYVEADLNLDIVGNIKGAVTVTAKGGLKLGGLYTREAGWEKIYEPRSLEGSGKAEAQGEVSILLQEEFTFFKLLGPQLEFGPYFTVSSNLQADPCNLDYKIGLKVKTGIDFALQFMDEALKGRKLEYELKSEITKGNYRICDTGPLAPSNLQAALDTEQPPGVVLNWKDNSDNEENFLVLWNDGGGWQSLAYVDKDQTGYYHLNPSPGLDNLYECVAVGKDHTMSAPSNLASVTMPEESAPATPQDLAATTDVPDVITVSWIDASDNEFGFTIERAEEEGGFEAIASVEADISAYADAAVVPSRTYSYRVFAFNTKTSDYSNIASASFCPFGTSPDALAAPSNLGAAVASDDSSVVLAWSDNSCREKGFAIERAEPTGGWSLLSTVAADVTGYTDGTVKKEQTYFYRVYAQGDIADSPYSNTAIAVVGGQPPSVSISGPTEVCVGADAALTASLDGTYADPVEYDWAVLAGNVQVSPATGDQVTATAIDAGSVTVYVEARDVASNTVVASTQYTFAVIACSSPDSEPFMVTDIVYDSTVVSGANPEELLIYWTGNPTFPIILSAIAKPGTCPTGFTCQGGSVSFTVRENPLRTGGFACAADDPDFLPAFLQFQLVFTDALGATDGPFDTPFNCVAP